MEIGKTAKNSGYSDNKNILFKKIDSIYIKSFRSLRERKIILGQNMTLISGKNGTMKSSMLGLIAHPFSSPNNAKDIFDKSLKTSMSDVFKMSLEKDNTAYRYYLNATTIDDICISEPIRMYPRPKEGRHRITVSTSNKSGDGNFSLNTAYINLKRLFPIIDTKADVMTEYKFSDEEKTKISEAYMRIMTRDSFSDFDCVSDYKEKNTLGPKNASYDFRSISSGEDNLGNILMKILAFEKNKSEHSALQGVFCIDELEASLHPVALLNLFDFLLSWSEKNYIQIVATTHSLYLLDHALKLQNKHESFKSKIAINIISTILVGCDNNYKVINNPSYKDAYKELTLREYDEEQLYKVNILCEDDIAKKLIKLIIAKRSILNNIELISDVSGGIGTAKSALISLGKNGYRLLEDAIIIVDPDVSVKEITPVLAKNIDILILPSLYKNTKNIGLALEKEIIKFIFKLDGSHEVFSNMEKIAILNTFYRYNIFKDHITPDANIQPFKNWCEAHTREFNIFLKAYFIENQNLFIEFKNQLICFINKKRDAKGLPLL